MLNLRNEASAYHGFDNSSVAPSLQLNGMLMMSKLHQAKQDYAPRGAL